MSSLFFTALAPLWLQYFFSTIIFSGGILGISLLSMVEMKFLYIYSINISNNIIILEKSDEIRHKHDAEYHDSTDVGICMKAVYNYNIANTCRALLDSKLVAVAGHAYGLLSLVES